MTMTKTDPRGITLDILLEVLEEGRLGHLVLNQALLKYQYLEKQDRSFITKLTEGTLERLILLDAALDRFSKTKTEKMKPVIRTILRMSAYQILFMDRVPDAAVCNEAVKLAKKKKIPGAFRLCQRSPADSFKGKGKAGIYGSVGALFHSRMDAFHVGG